MKSQTLTKQETKITHLIAQGFIEKEIACKLFISHHTVHTHYKTIRQKLSAKNIADITRVYMLSLPNITDVLKAVLFLTIQFHLIINDTNIDLRRPGKTKTKTEVRAGKCKRKEMYYYE